MILMKDVRSRVDPNQVVNHSDIRSTECHSPIYTQKIVLSMCFLRYSSLDLIESDILCLMVANYPPIQPGRHFI